MEAAPTDHFRHVRLLVGAAAVLVLLPSLLIALLGLLITLMMVSQSSPVGMLSVLQVVVALVALAATTTAAYRFHRDGIAGITSLSAWTLGAMHAGAAMVGIGVLAVWIGSYFPLGYSGKHLAANVLGIPALVPYGLLIWLRRRNLPAGVASAPFDARRVLWGPCFVLALAMVSLAVMGPRPFDRELWSTLADEQDDVWLRRQRMALWLIGTQAMRGNERLEVVALLGHPMESDWFGDGEIAYPLGRGLGFFLVDNNWLLIGFDESDRVSSIRIVAPD